MAGAYIGGALIGAFFFAIWHSAGSRQADGRSIDALITISTPNAPDQATSFIQTLSIAECRELRRAVKRNPPANSEVTVSCQRPAIGRTPRHGST
jgi:hypothetical protein